MTKKAQCLVCRRFFERNEKGRTRRYCSPTCKQRAYAKRKNPVTHAIVTRETYPRGRLRRKCKNCGSGLEQPEIGRKRLFCSASCRQQAYADRKATSGIPARLLSSDFEHWRTKAGVEKLVIEILQRHGLLARSSTPRKPHLRIVQDDSEKE